MRGTFQGIGFESGFEKKFLEQCYQLGIKVERSKKTVKYKDAHGKWHEYHPDFFWPDLNYTIEIKGAWAFRDNHGNVREKYAAAMISFGGRYTIITEKELKTTFVADLFRSLHQERVTC
jgi:hypothetical protein